MVHIVTIDKWLRGVLIRSEIKKKKIHITYETLLI